MTESAQRILSLGEKNSIKNKMAVAFMHALNSTVDYHFQENSREFDGLGFDLTIMSKTVGTKRTIASAANLINVQLKGVAESSSTMFSETSSHISYKLSDDLLSFGSVMYLVVVVLPPDDDIENWSIISDKDALLKARGYYIRVEEKLAKGKVKIPKTQQLDLVTFRQMFNASPLEVVS